MHYVVEVVFALGVVLQTDVFMDLAFAEGENARVKAVERVNRVFGKVWMMCFFYMHAYLALVLFVLRLWTKTPEMMLPAFVCLLHMAVWRLYYLQNEVQQMTYEASEKIAEYKRCLNNARDDAEESTDCSSSDETY